MVSSETGDGRDSWALSHCMGVVRQLPHRRQVLSRVARSVLRTGSPGAQRNQHVSKNRDMLIDVVGDRSPVVVVPFRVEPRPGLLPRPRAFHQQSRPGTRSLRHKAKQRAVLGWRETIPVGHCMDGSCRRGKVAIWFHRWEGDSRESQIPQAGSRRGVVPVDKGPALGAAYQVPRSEIIVADDVAAVGNGEPVPRS